MLLQKFIAPGLLQTSKTNMRYDIR